MTVQKKSETDSTCKLQEHKWFTHSLKLWLNLCSFRWLSPSLNLVSNLNHWAHVYCKLVYGYWPIFNKAFLKDNIVVDCRILQSRGRTNDLYSVTRECQWRLLLGFLMMPIPLSALDIFSLIRRLKFRVSSKYIPISFCQLAQKTSALLKNIFGSDDLFNFLENITSWACLFKSGLHEIFHS